MKIIPISVLKNPVNVERFCVKENGQVFVTKNDKIKLVVMNLDSYEKTMRKVYEARIVLSVLDDVKTFNTEDGETVISNIRSKYGI